MKKLLTCMLISTTIHAEVITSTEVIRPPFATPKVNFTTNSNHAYSITNESVLTQSYHVCFIQQICPEYPYYTKTKSICFDREVNGLEFVSDSYGLVFTEQLPLSRVQCKIHATTIISGFESKQSDDEKMMQFL